jgi:hypothetical protein
LAVCDILLVDMTLEGRDEDHEDCAPCGGILKQYSLISRGGRGYRIQNWRVRRAMYRKRNGFNVVTKRHKTERVSDILGKTKLWLVLSHGGAQSTESLHFDGSKFAQEIPFNRTLYCNLNVTIVQTSRLELFLGGTVCSKL